VLPACEEVGDGVGHGVFDKPGGGFMSAGVVAVARAGDYLDGFVVEFEEALPGNLPTRVIAGLELGEQVE
jgi:hypothetical protein